MRSVDLCKYLYAHTVIRCRDGHSEREKPCFQHQVGETHELVSNVGSRNHEMSRPKRIPNVRCVIFVVLVSFSGGVDGRLFAFMDVRYVYEYIGLSIGNKLILRVLQDVDHFLPFGRIMGLSVNHAVRFYVVELPEAERT